MTTQTEQGGPPDLGLSSSADAGHSLTVLDQALATPEVTITKLRLVRLILDEKCDLDICTDQDLVNLLDCSERTAWDARQ